METDGTETQISVYTNGIFDIYSAAGFTLGAMLGIDAANDLKDADNADITQGSFLGQALEVATAGQTKAVRVLR